MKTSQALAMARLAAANPTAESAAPRDWPKSEEDALLKSLRDQIDAEPGPPLWESSAASVLARRNRFKRPIVIAFAAVAAGMVTFGLLSSNSSAPGAFAQWSPMTRNVPVSQLAAAQSGCQQAWSRSIHLIPPVSGGLVGSLPSLVLTDTRGPFELLFFAGPSAESVCLWKDGFIGVSGSNGLIGLPPPNDQSIGVPGVGFSSVRGAPYTYAIGRAGPGVKGVTLVLANGTSVETTLQNGFYGAWWPIKSDVMSALVSTATGTSNQNLGDVGSNNNGPPNQ